MLHEAVSLLALANPGNEPGPAETGYELFDELKCIRVKIACCGRHFNVCDRGLVDPKALFAEATGEFGGRIKMLDEALPQVGGFADVERSLEKTRRSQDIGNVPLELLIVSETPKQPSLARRQGCL
jgi:hypothetical protein